MHPHLAMSSLNYHHDGWGLTRQPGQEMPLEIGVSGAGWVTLAYLGVPSSCSSVKLILGGLTVLSRNSGVREGPRRVGI